MSPISERFSEFAEKYRLVQAYRSSLGAAMTAWGWVQERMWPVYSTGLILSALFMLASANEKQILADHLYGSDVVLQKEREKTVEEARKLFREESVQGVKQVVWMLPSGEFRGEYKERYGNV
ncbi:putative Archaic Translocase of outer membrane 14 kDa subunit [Trypanosoma cruzi]|uniref:Archaic Translocase of outer membrane 14 kDa subunit n=2 Tax=Trypanosoma cruzi TaxID=5693 RepID=Q4DV52_TRYCC|nr:hypothetical protein, conserved [Trypanosoma cruzi]EAN96394.1 hypothetical protein, conserved [Trypanosoma cruzi]PWV19107.1 putative Archaic Translocase of outer membrane 14 kDa subunit [Trypanosoma cruzi]|eukprot:XP_818245.1 hypothetical protein [Trypanosoma cruzi strain CL Brener]